MELHPPCQGAGLSVSGTGLQYVVLLGFLQAFRASGMNMAASRSLALELGVCTPYSSVHPHRKLADHSCLPSVRLHSVHPACARAFLSQARDPVSSLQTYRLTQRRPAPFLPGEGGGSLRASAFRWAPAQRAVTRLCSSSRFMATRAESRRRDPLFAGSLPALMPGSSAALTHLCSCDPGILRAHCPPGMPACFTT